LVLFLLKQRSISGGDGGGSGGSGGSGGRGGSGHSDGSDDGGGCVGVGSDDDVVVFMLSVSMERFLFLTSMLFVVFLPGFASPLSFKSV